VTVGREGDKVKPNGKKRSNLPSATWPAARPRWRPVRARRQAAP